jgi:hypothetical protein
MARRGWPVACGGCRSSLRFAYLALPQPAGSNPWRLILIEISSDSPLEGAGFEPSVPLLRKALLGVANRRRRHERRRHLQVQVRNGNACLEWLPIAFPFAEGGTASSNPSSSSAESVSLMDWGRWRPNARLLRQSVGGLGREKGRAGRQSAPRGRFSLTGIDAVPFRQSSAGRNDKPAAVRTAVCGISSGCAAQLANSLRCSVQSNGRSSSVRRVAVSSTGCRPCKLASTSSGLRKARQTRRRI